MKTLRTIAFCIVLASVSVFDAGCPSVPSSRTTEVTTLKIVGQTAKTAIDAAASLLKQGKITVAQWQQVADLYDTKFQPTYAVAVAAVNSDLSSIASPDLVALAGQIAVLVADLTQPHP